MCRFLIAKEPPRYRAWRARRGQPSCLGPEPSAGFGSSIRQIWGTARHKTEKVLQQWRAYTLVPLRQGTFPSMQHLVTESPCPTDSPSPRTVAEALEHKPMVSPVHLASCQAAATVVCFASYCLVAYVSGMQELGAPAAAALAMALYSGVVALLCGWLHEWEYKALQRSERQLARHNSRFLPIASEGAEAIEVHYTVARPVPSQPFAGLLTPSSKPEAAPQVHLHVHCVHGLGANTYSWSFVQDMLAAQLGAVTTAHDIPGFGLTQRRPAPSFYTLDFNTVAMHAIAEAELPRSAQGAKRVLIGHSFGGAAVAEAVIQDPEGIAALVLVAPAIMAMWPWAHARDDNVAAVLSGMEELVGAQDLPMDPPCLGSSQYARFSSQDLGGRQLGHPAWAQKAAATQLGTPVLQAQAQSGLRHAWHRQWLRAVQVAASVYQAASVVVLRQLLRLSEPLLVLLLRRLVRSRGFWEMGLAAMWLDKGRITRDYVDGYRCAQLAHGWETGLLHFLEARLAEKPTLWEVLAHALRGDHTIGQAERLAQAIELHRIPVLIVHGTADRLVPLVNSCRLARLLPGARLVQFECGHMPHEEMPAQFVAEVADFLERQQVSGH